jgi:hypothetical protein
MRGGYLHYQRHRQTVDVLTELLLAIERKSDARIKKGRVAGDISTLVGVQIPPLVLRNCYVLSHLTELKEKMRQQY